MKPSSFTCSAPLVSPSSLAIRGSVSTTLMLTGTIREWGDDCHQSCLKAAALPLHSKTASSVPDVSSIPVCYHGLREVFNKVKATSLPPHRPYDCAINLLSGTAPPKGRLYSLSAPERKAMEDYINNSLAAGIIRPSSSPAGAGFFFVGKKDGSQIGRASCRERVCLYV